MKDDEPDTPFWPARIQILPVLKYRVGALSGYAKHVPMLLTIMRYTCANFRSNGSLCVRFCFPGRLFSEGFSGHAKTYWKSGKCVLLCCLTRSFRPAESRLPHPEFWQLACDAVAQNQTEPNYRHWAAFCSLHRLAENGYRCQRKRIDHPVKCAVKPRNS